MDSKGYWHNDGEADLAKKMMEAMDREKTSLVEPRPRYVTHMEVGEVVEIVKADGTRIKAQFWEAKKNKVTLRTLPVEETR